MRFVILLLYLTVLWYVGSGRYGRHPRRIFRAVKWLWGIAWY